MRQSGKRETADMAEHIQHARTLAKLGSKGVIGTLIEKQPRLLPLREIRHVDSAVHGNLHWPCRRCPSQHGRRVVQSFQRARPARRVFQDICRTCHIGQGSGQILQHRIRPGSVGLNHAGIAKAVDHDAGQAISLGMDQAIKGSIEQSLAQGKRAAQAQAQPRAVNGPGRIQIQHPRHDPRPRIDRDERKRHARGILKQRNAAGGKGLAAPVQNKLVIINPRHAPAYPRGRSFRIEADHGQGGMHHAIPLRAFARCEKRKAPKEKRVQSRGRDFHPPRRRGVCRGNKPCRSTSVIG